MITLLIELLTRLKFLRSFQRVDALSRGSVRIDGTRSVAGPDTGLVSGMRLGSDTGEL